MSSSPTVTNGIEKGISKNKYNGKPVTEILTNGFFTLDQKWTVKYWNGAAEKIMGVKAKEIVGKNIWEKFISVIPVEFYSVYDKAFLQDTPVHFKEYWREKGAWFDVITYYCNDTLFVSFKSSKQPNSGYSDNPQEQLKTLTELYRYVTEITNDSLWEWDLKNGEIFWIDGGHKRMFGYQIENALVSQSFWESRIHPEDKERVRSKLDAMLKRNGNEVWEIEYRFRKADGSYTYVRDRGHIIYEKNKPSRMIGATQDITEKVRLTKKLEADGLIRQREIATAVLIAQEKEREEIGRELHDNLNQVLSAVKMYTQMAMSSEQNREAYLQKSIELTDNVISTIRDISKSLVLPAAHIIGVLDNIKNLVHDLMKINPIRIEFFDYGIDETILDEKLQVHIFRIVQEQLNNILKHSKASHASIHLRMKADNISLLISDNGKGFEESSKIKGVGLINIRSRAAICHGTVSVITYPGQGYALKVVLQNPASPAKEELITNPGEEVIPGLSKA